MTKFPDTDAYIASCTEPVARLLTDLRRFIHETLPNVTEAMQYGVPTFLNSQKVPVIYLFGSADHVNFGFLQSEALIDPAGVLKGSGKPSKHVEIGVSEPVDKEMLAGFINQCADIAQ